METRNRDEEWYFFYNADGRRIKRINDDRQYVYTYAGDLLSRMTVDGHTLSFIYDTNGSPIMMTMDGCFYYFVTNLQGDIIAILNSSGNPVVQYTYDAWGNLLSTTGSLASTVGFYNPLRYRGYVYDEETKLYYVTSRYYNPEMGRFLNADTTAILTATPMGVTDKNLFAYCDNNPVMREDHGGNFWNVIVGAAAGAVLGAVTQVVSNAINGDSLLSGVGTAVAVGGISGAIAATSWSASVQAITTGIISGVGDVVQQKKTSGKVNILHSIKTGIVAGTTSAIGSYAGSKLFKGVDDLGNSLIQKGYSQAAKGVDRALRGLSHTSYYRSGAKALAKGKSIVNVYQGFTSTLGSLIGIAPGLANNLIEPYTT